MECYYYIEALILWDSENNINIWRSLLFFWL
jgi:hypothetical protein